MTLTSLTNVLFLKEKKKKVFYLYGLLLEKRIYIYEGNNSFDKVDSYQTPVLCGWLETKTMNIPEL